MTEAGWPGPIDALLESLGLPEVPRVPLEPSPLALALCQVRVPPLFSVADEAFVGQFQRAIQDDYPVANRQTQEVGVELQIGGVAEPELRGRHRASAWHFSDRTDTWRIVLATDFVALETYTYSDFAEYLSRLRGTLDAFRTHFQPALVSRIGLRYINEIRLQGTSAAAIVRPELLGPLTVPVLEPYAQVALQQVLLRYPSSDGELGINVNHGRLPRGSSVQRRRGDEVNTDPFYLLDFDAFCDFGKAVRPEFPAFDLAEICRFVEVQHKAIYRVFRWSVTDEFVARWRG